MYGPITGYHILLLHDQHSSVPLSMLIRVFHPWPSPLLISRKLRKLRKPALGNWETWGNWDNWENLENLRRKLRILRKLYTENWGYWENWENLHRKLRILRKLRKLRKPYIENWEKPGKFSLMVFFHSHSSTFHGNKTSRAVLVLLTPFVGPARFSKFSQFSFSQFFIIFFSVF